MRLPSQRRWLSRMATRLKDTRLQPEGMTVVARVLYQTIPPAWAEPLRTLDAQEAKTFITMYDTAVPKPEQVAVTVAFEEK